MSSIPFFSFQGIFNKVVGVKKNLVSTLASPLKQIIEKKSQILRPLIDATKSITGNIILTKQMVVKPFIKQVLGGLKMFTYKPKPKP